VERNDSELKISFKYFSSTLIFKFGFLPPYSTAGISPLVLKAFSCPAVFVSRLMAFKLFVI
jgi:hypothetical protein